MSTTLKLKKSSVGGKVPTTSDLEYGELALNYADGCIYYKNSSNVIKKFAVIKIPKSYQIMVCVVLVNITWGKD